MGSPEISLTGLEVCEESLGGGMGVGGRLKGPPEDLRIQVRVGMGGVPVSWLLTGPTGGYMCVSLRLPMDPGG